MVGFAFSSGVGTKRTQPVWLPMTVIGVLLGKWISRKRVRPNFDLGAAQIPFGLSDSEVAMKKVVGAAVIVLAVLYFADQQLAQGKYTDAVQRMAGQIRHSTGI
jgi:hypothetical protein